MNEKQRARINFMKERVVNTIPEMDLENARILTESFEGDGWRAIGYSESKVFSQTVPGENNQDMGSRADRRVCRK